MTSAARARSEPRALRLRKAAGHPGAAASRRPSPPRPACARGAGAACVPRPHRGRRGRQDLGLLARAPRGCPSLLPGPGELLGRSSTRLALALPGSSGRGRLLLRPRQAAATSSAVRLPCSREARSSSASICASSSASSDVSSASSPPLLLLGWRVGAGALARGARGCGRVRLLRFGRRRGEGGCAGEGGLASRRGTAGGGGGARAFGARGPPDGRRGVSWAGPPSAGTLPGAAGGVATGEAAGGASGPVRRCNGGSGRGRLRRLVRSEGVVPGIRALLSHPEHGTAGHEGQPCLEEDRPPVPAPQRAVPGASGRAAPRAHAPRATFCPPPTRPSANTFPQLPHRYRRELAEDSCGGRWEGRGQPGPSSSASASSRRRRAATRSLPSARCGGTAAPSGRSGPPPGRGCAARPGGAGRPSGAPGPSPRARAARPPRCRRPRRRRAPVRGARSGAAAPPPPAPLPAPDLCRPPSPARASESPRISTMCGAQADLAGDRRQSNFHRTL